MAIYYVTTSGSDSNGGTNDTTDSFASWGKLGSTLGDKDIGYIKAGTYNLSTGTIGANGGPMRLPNTLACLVEGYETTPGDNCPTNDRPVLNRNGQTVTNMVTLRGNFQNIQIVKNLKVDGTDGATNGFYAASVNECHVCINCEATQCGASYGANFNGISCYFCISHDSLYRGYLGNYFHYCIAYDNGQGLGGGQGFHAAGSINHCIAYRNAIGFGALSYPHYQNCIAYDNDTWGFGCDYVAHATNCISVLNGTYGFTEVGDGALLINCASYSNTAGRTTTSNFIHDIGPILLSGDPFMNGASGDFSLNLLSNAGLACKNTGVVPIGQTGYFDIGAVQSKSQNIVPRLRVI